MAHCSYLVVTAELRVRGVAAVVVGVMNVSRKQ
jgi:hypothetical protein